MLFLEEKTLQPRMQGLLSVRHSRTFDYKGFLSAPGEIGRRGRLKIFCPKGRAGSSPVGRTLNPQLTFVIRFMKNLVKIKWINSLLKVILSAPAYPFHYTSVLTGNLSKKYLKAIADWIPIPYAPPYTGKISRSHLEFSGDVDDLTALTNPEPFLGPNWETVLRWWLYAESLTDEQKNELLRRYDAIDLVTRERARALAFYAVIEVNGLDNMLAVCGAAPYSAITMELITMHLLFERGHQLTFVPLIKDL